MRPPRPLLSLRGRALQLLARRDQSCAELRRKLLPHARTAIDEAANGAAVVDEALADPAERRAAALAAVDALLDELAAHGLLNDARFVESRVHARASRFGNRRIRQELAHHGLAVDGPTGSALLSSELERARGVWRQKFGRPPEGPAERARQMRFLAGRGFSNDVIRRAVEADDDL